MKDCLRSGAFLGCTLFLPTLLAHAATTISHRSVPTPGVANHVTVTLTAESDAGAYVGFNFSAANNSGLGFVGTLNQVNPFGASTIFNDIPPESWYLGESSPLVDTHFLAKSADGLVIAASESATLLSGAYNTFQNNPISQPFDFVQLVIPIGQTVSYRGAFTLKNGSAPAFLESVVGSITIPEPTALAMASANFLGFGIALRLAARRH